MTVNLLVPVLVISFICIANAQEPVQLLSDLGLNAKELIEKYGYPLEVHTITTTDGYILETHRIPHGRNNNSTASKHPVLFMPGVLCSSADFLTMGPTSSLAYMLADAGYDVWLANYRGTRWSMKHVSLDPVVNEKEFFDYSYQEIGLNDVTANIDYILNSTNRSKLFYIGHSQGTTSYFAMAAAKPEYNSKILLMNALAPVAYSTHIKQPIIFIFKAYLKEIQQLCDENNIHGILSHSVLLTVLGQVLCNDDSPTQDLCAGLLYFISGYSTNLNKTVLPLITSNTPAGASVRILLHYAQQSLVDKFQMFDFGATENMDKYGQQTPPEFDLTKITSPVAVYYANQDLLSSMLDVNRLKSELPNVIKDHYIEGYNHLDYLWGKNVVPLLYNPIIETIKKYS